MKQIALLATMACCGLLVACGRQKVPYATAGDADLRIEVTPLRAEKDGSIRSFRVRLTPDGKIAAGLTHAAGESLNYRMDSCFYSGTGRNKERATLVQAVAAGTNHSYEYLLVFDGRETVGDSTTLTYQDKYINHKTYTLKIAATR